MLSAFISSARLHIFWWWQSFTEEGRRCSPLGTRRLLFLCIIYPLFCILQLFHWFAFLIDELIFPKYRKVSILKPVFITGIPRSGTTYLHRSLAEDTAEYFTISTWQAVAAPAICEQKLIFALGVLDKMLGNPAQRLIVWINNKLCGSLNEIHKVGLNAPEEDYLLLLPIGGCFIFSLAFPASTELRQLVFFEQINPKRKEQILNFYHRSLQRQLYSAKKGRRLLSKNAAFGSWTSALADHFPDGSLTICIREPTTALSSQLSAIAPASKLFGTAPGNDSTRDQFTEMFRSTYQHLAKSISGQRAENDFIIEQQDLKKDSSQMVESISRSLRKLPLDHQAKNASQNSDKKPTKSPHSYNSNDFDLDSTLIKTQIDPHYRALLSSPNRIQLKHPTPPEAN